MTPTRLRECLALLRWSQRGLADILDTHQTTVRRWATGAQPIPENVAAWLERLSAVHAKYEYPDDWKQYNPQSVEAPVP